MKRTISKMGLWIDMSEYIYREPFSSTQTHKVVSDFKILLRNGNTYHVKKGFSLYTHEKALEGPLSFTEIKTKEKKQSDGSFLSGLLNLATDVLDVMVADKVEIEWHEIQEIISA